MEGGGIRPPQVENVLNHPGEIGLMHMILYNLTYMILYDINTPFRLLGIFSNEFVIRYFA